MRLTKKTVILAIALVAIITGTVFGTVAYLTDSSSVTNTFSIGKVGITVDETVVDEDGIPVDKDGNPVVDENGNPIPSDNRTEEGNTYPMIPGKPYVKDPTMTVDKGSEPAYYRMKVTLNCYEELAEIFGSDKFGLGEFVTDLNTVNWELQSETVVDTTANTITYEFRYIGDDPDTTEADAALPPLFTQLQIPTIFDNEDLAALHLNDDTTDNDFKMDIVGNAIQKTGFENVQDVEPVDAAWKAFDAQVIAKAEKENQNTDSEVTNP